MSVSVESVAAEVPVDLSCPFTAAFRAVVMAVEYADPGGEPREILQEYGVSQGLQFIGAQALLESCLAGDWKTSAVELDPALRVLAEFVEAWAPSARDHVNFDPDLVLAMISAAQDALPAYVAGLSAGRSASVRGVEFRGALAAARALGWESGVELRGFVAGWNVVLPRGVDVDPMTGLVVGPRK